jgi:hypothetical protein
MAIEQIQVRTNLPGPKPGSVLSPSYMTDEINLPHGADKAAQVVDITVDAAPVAGSVVSYFIEGELISHTVLSGQDETDVALALEAAHNANPLARGLMTASSATDTVTLTANVSRESFAVEGGLQVSVVEATPASLGAAFPVAVAVYQNNGLATTVRPSGTTTATIVASALAATIPTHLSLSLGGEVFTVTRVGAGGGDTDAQLATAIRALVDALPGFSASGTGANIIISASEPFQVISRGTSLGAPTFSAVGVALEAALLGISRYLYDEEQASIAAAGALAIPAKRDVVCVRRGVVAVDSAPSASRGGVVYVGVGTNAETGKFFDASGANRSPLPRTAAQWDGPNRLMLTLA